MIKYLEPLPNCPLCRGTGDKYYDDVQLVWTRCPCTTDPLYFTKEELRDFTKKEIRDASDAVLQPATAKPRDRRLR